MFTFSIIPHSNTRIYHKPLKRRAEMKMKKTLLNSFRPPGGEKRKTDVCLESLINCVYLERDGQVGAREVARVCLCSYSVSRFFLSPK